MAKGVHRESQRIILPNGMWVLIYSDSSIKIAGYDRRLLVHEVLNREGGAHVFITVKTADGIDIPRSTQERASDLVTVPREVQRALSRLPSSS